MLYIKGDVRVACSDCDNVEYGMVDNVQNLVEQVRELFDDWLISNSEQKCPECKGG